ncbi:MAG: zinc-ribbon domain-containing protein [Methylobacillus sp.]|jgi:predicted Zn finger-like uncharacterized protein|nr:zinc-ribbon domain-containing protein [Methylobacillus sp.]
MNLLTFCPACGTAFRITTEQLSLSHGDVRCSKCGEVFNALKSLSFQRKTHREVALPNDALIPHADKPVIPETPGEVWDPAATPLPQPSFEYAPKVAEFPPPTPPEPLPPEPEPEPMALSVSAPAVMPEPMAELPPQAEIKPEPETKPELQPWSHLMPGTIPKAEPTPPPVAPPQPKPEIAPAPESAESPLAPKPWSPPAPPIPEPPPEKKFLELEPETPPEPEPQPLAPWPEIKSELLPPTSKPEEIRLELEPETKPESAPNQAPWPKLEPWPHLKPGVKPESKPIPKPTPKPILPKPIPAPITKPLPPIAPKPVVKPEPAPVPAHEPKPELKPEPKPEPKHIPAPPPKHEPPPEPKFEPKPEPKPAPAPIVKPEPAPLPTPPTAEPESDESEIIIPAPPSVYFTSAHHHEAAPHSADTTLGVPAMPPPSDEKPRSWLWMIVCVLVLLALLGQTIFLTRTQIASSLPRTKPWLEQACAMLGCKVEFPRDEEALHIEDSDLQPLPDHDDIIQLTATITNKAHFTQAYPLLEVTLTDVHDTPVLRRTLQPAEYLPSGTVVENGLGAKSEVQVKFLFTAPEVSATGYKIYVRYP